MQVCQMMFEYWCVSDGRTEGRIKIIFIFHRDANQWLKGNKGANNNAGIQKCTHTALEVDKCNLCILFKFPIYTLYSLHNIS